jgi:peptide/nickel transport system permease protein
MSTVDRDPLPTRNLIRWPKWLRRGGWSFAIGLIGLALIVLAAISAPLLTPYDPTALDLVNARLPPGWAHPFGTDNLGRDILARVLFAARIDLQIGAIGVAVPLVIGTLIGLPAGYLGGWIDALVGRVIDVIIAFPFLVLVITIVAVLGPGLFDLYVALTLASWVLYARIVRGEALALRSREYVLAARSLGFGSARIILRHILPNAIAPALVFAMSDFALDVQVGATLSFFGVGVQPPTPDWGLMIAETRTYMLSAPWMVIFPGLAIITLSLFVSLVGDGLADLVRGLNDG